jgi:NADH:ubiquinone oxidoreductase subunit 5 (subunit L)/multisubunit Na+/H+ antiporter MnhA subunit
MTHIIHVFILLPLLSFLISLVLPKNRELLIGRFAQYSVGVQLFFTIGFLIYWLTIGAPNLNLQDISLYDEPAFDFYIDFFLDKLTAVFMLVGVLITFVVVSYSRVYMHKEEGFKRFYNTILFFWFGYVLTIWSGNFGTLFIGWEFLGLSSFLLIAFYRTRYLPVHNAVKVFSIYRIGDIGILLTLWASHHLLHQNFLFAQMESVSSHHAFVENPWVVAFIALMILIAALAKSAQFPFSSWLPRAMEGPTPSSAIFYGALSVHMGAFLLMRTSELWDELWSMRVLIGVLGAITFLLSNFTAQAQSTIKGKIAYSSSAQIGVIFIEIALGWHILALFHFAGNAFLRSYQLLISPSVATYLIRDQFYNFKERQNEVKSKFKRTIQMLSLQEWYLEKLQYQLIFSPIKRFGKLGAMLTQKGLLLTLAIVYFIGFMFVHFDLHLEQFHISMYLSVLLAAFALVTVSRVYIEKGRAVHAWLLLLFVHLLLDLSISLNDHFDLKETSVYLSGVLVSGIIGLIILLKMERLHAKPITLLAFNGLVGKHPKMAGLFLLAALGVAGFPITTTFLGEDLLMSHIELNQVLLAFLVAAVFIINGIAIIRIYARVFLGSREKSYNSTNHLSL